MVGVDEVVGFEGDDDAWNREDGGLRFADPVVAEVLGGRGGRFGSPVFGQGGGAQFCHEGVVEFNAKRDVVEIDDGIEVDEDFERSEREGGARVDNGDAARIPAAAGFRGAVAGERGCGVPLFHDAPGDGHSGIDAVFDSSEQVLDFARADFGLGEMEGGVAGESELGGGHPLFRGVLGFHYLDGFAEQACESDNAIGFGGVEFSFRFAPVQRRLGNAEHGRELIHGEIERGAKGFEFTVGKSGLQGFDDGEMGGRESFGGRRVREVTADDAAGGG